MDKNRVPVENHFDHIAFYKCNKLYEITPKKRKGSYGSSIKQSAKASNSSQNEMTISPLFCQFLWNLKFIFPGSHKKLFFALEKCKKRIRYNLKFSGTRFLPLKIKIIQFPDGVRLYIRPQVAFEEIIGSLNNDHCDGNEHGKKAKGLDWQNNNFARASRFSYIS